MWCVECGVHTLLFCMGCGQPLCAECARAHDLFTPGSAHCKAPQ